MILVLIWWFEYQLHARELGAPCHPRISEVPDLFCAAGRELPRLGCHQCDRGVTAASWRAATEQGKVLKRVRIKVLPCDSPTCKWETE